MTVFESNARSGSLALANHLMQFPEDLRDIRRLQKRFRTSPAEAARALERWRTVEEVLDTLRPLAH